MAGYQTQSELFESAKTLEGGNNRFASHCSVFKNMSDSEDIPDVQTCQKLVEEFAAITDTDVACAQFFLQDRKWNLERSVNDYLDAKSTSGVTVIPSSSSGRSRAGEASVVINVNKSLASALETVPKRYPSPPKHSIPPHSYRGLETSTLPPPRLCILSWNIDGLDEHNLKRRTKAVCHIIFSKSPDVVFLQEVIPKTFVYIKKNLPEYYCIPSCKGRYFTVTMLRLFTVKFDSYDTVPFPDSSMGRNLLVVKAHMGSLKLALINTHLESSAEYASERMQQLKKAFQVAIDMPSDETVFFGGDLNLRDKELVQCGGIPSGMCDIWEACGSRDQCKYTWDTLRNSNNQTKTGSDWKGSFRPRCRFDRLYLRQSSPPMLKADFFGVLGMKKVPNTQSFPSDHWAIWAYFALLVRESAGSSKVPAEKFEDFASKEVDLFSSSDEETPSKRAKTPSPSENKD